MTLNISRFCKDAEKDAVDMTWRIELNINCWFFITAQEMNIFSMFSYDKRLEQRPIFFPDDVFPQIHVFTKGPNTALSASSKRMYCMWWQELWMNHHVPKGVNSKDDDVSCTNCYNNICFFRLCDGAMSSSHRTVQWAKYSSILRYDDFILAFPCSRSYNRFIFFFELAVLIDPVQMCQWSHD